MHRYLTGMMIRHFSIAFLAIAGMMMSAIVAAQTTPKNIGSFKAWDAFIYEEKGARICYMVSKPTKSKPENVRRGDIFFMVTHRPGESVRDEVSLYIGYPYKKGSAAKVKIGSKAYSLITDDENAWAPDAATDKKMVNAMIKGSQMRVEGLSHRDTRTTDTYSLLGFTAAHRAIDKACR